MPEAVHTGGGRRGARIPPHGKLAARRAVGLEAALFDHSPITITALDPADYRQITVAVAGVTALLVAKAHKIQDRIADTQPDRLSDKDAADVYRIMQTARPGEVAVMFDALLAEPVAADVTRRAMEYFATCSGVERARALRWRSVPSV